MLKEAAGETPFEPYKLFQLPISELEDISVGKIPTPKGWVNLSRNGPYFR
jgi:hypothetical protein